MAKEYTLTQISSRTKISMPSLLKYKETHRTSAKLRKQGDMYVRIDAQGNAISHGEGRSMRFYYSAFAYFKSCHKNGLARRGRPRKDGTPVRQSTMRQTRRVMA